MESPSITPSELALQHEKRIGQVANLIIRRFRLRKSDYHDLYQLAMVEAIRESRKFLDGRKVQKTFWAFAWKRIYYSLFDFVRTRQGEVALRHEREMGKQGQSLCVRSLDGLAECDLGRLSDESSGVVGADAGELIDFVCRNQTERTRLILRARFVEGLTNREIAKRFRSTPGSIGVTIHSAMERFRNLAKGPSEPVPCPIRI